jgi:hypothetical protein
MQKMEVKELSRGDFIQWDAFVDSSSNGTIFHKTGWLDTCARSLGKKVKIFGCFDNGNLVGGCSLFIGNLWGIVPIAESICPMTPYGGFLMSPFLHGGGRKKEFFNRQILDSLISFIEDEHFLKINIRNSPGFSDIRPFTWNGWKSEVFFTYYFNLEWNIESHIDHSLKRNIRKAEKNNIIIETSTDISKYYSLLCGTYSRKNMKPPTQKHLLYELFSFIKDQNCGEMLVAKTPNNDIICARITLWDNRQAINWTAASDFDFLNTNATTLLHFENFKRLKEKGFSSVNMMMANVPQLSDYASFFNPTLVPYFEVHKSIFDRFL